jgi:endonuclease IV
MKNILILVITGAIFMGCGNTSQKEMEQVDALLTLVKETEKELLAIDTSMVFAMKQQIVLDFKTYSQFSDTVSKEEALRVDEIFGNKKKFTKITKNYHVFINDVNHAKEQLSQLKTDLENELVSKDDYQTYYESEKAAVNHILLQVKKSTSNFDIAIGKYELERPELLKLIENRRQRSAVYE